MRHMLQGAREGTSDAGQPISRGADRPPAARAGAERADGRELYPAQWDLPPHLLSVAQEVRRPHGDRGHPAQAPGARECPLEGAARRSGAGARGAERDQRKKMERVAVRRAQVRYAMTRRLSCRRACVLLRVARSALGYAARRSGRDATLVAELQRLAAAHPRYGYRRTWALLRRRGLAVNPKRVHRLWRCAGLALPRRRVRRKVRTGARVRPLADRPNAVWTYDLIHDACTNGTPFKCLTVVDEFTKECLAMTVARSLPGDRVLPRPLPRIRTWFASSRAPPSKVHLPVTRDFTASSRRSLPGRKTEKSDFAGPYEDRNDVSVTLEDDIDVGFWFRRALVGARMRRNADRNDDTRTTGEGMANDARRFCCSLAHSSQRVGPSRCACRWREGLRRSACRF